MKVAFEARYPTVKVTETSTVFPWMVRHAAWLCTRYGVKQDGRTAYERLRNRSYKGEVAEFGEVVLYKFSNQNLKKLEDKWACGVWLGKMSTSLRPPMGFRGVGPLGGGFRRKGLRLGMSTT